MHVSQICLMFEMAYLAAPDLLRALGNEGYNYFCTLLVLIQYVARLALLKTLIQPN